LFCGWGFLAGSYAGVQTASVSDMSEDELGDVPPRSAREARRGAMSAFFGNAIEQLPNMPAVISWHFSNRI
jgi:hypothetical protein